MIPVRQESRLQLRLQDVLAVMVGYGMAALLFRAFWPATRPRLALSLPAMGLYLWLGMAMSGPILLWRRRPSASPPPANPLVAAGAPSWSELAWALIGSYWIVLGVIVIPARLQEFRPRDMLFFGLVPIVVALALRVFGARPGPEGESKRAWTHMAGVVLVLTWPIAWACLIVLGLTMR